MRQADKINALNAKEIDCVTGGSVIPPAIGIYDYWPFNIFVPRHETGHDEDQIPGG